MTEHIADATSTGTAPPAVITPGAYAEMTPEQRYALPPEHHTPVWYEMVTPHLWLCQVCWGDDRVTSWPCEVARRDGRPVAERLGLAVAR
jgi:hypothetical protein